MNYNDIKDMTNEEAVVYFGPITMSYVPCSDLENLLGWADLAKRNAVSGAWEGSLLDFMSSEVVPAISDGLSELFSHLNKPRSVGCDTNSQPWASKMADLLSGLEAVAMIDSQFTADVVALAGGYAYADLDVDAVQLIRSEGAQNALDQEAREAFDVNMVRYNELYNIHIATLAVDHDADDSSWVAALQAMSDNFVAPQAE